MFAKKKYHKWFLMAVALILLGLVVSAIWLASNYETIQEERLRRECARQMPIAYFTLLNEQKLDEAFSMLYLRPEQEVLIDYLRYNYEVYPAKFSNIRTSRVKRVNGNLYRIDVTLYNGWYEEDERLDTYVSHDGDVWRLMINPRHVPDEYSENITIPYNPDYIDINDLITEFE